MDESRKTTAFTDLYRLIQEGETLLNRGDLDGALAKYRQAAQVAPRGTQMEQQITLTIQSILRSKQAAESSGPTLVQKAPDPGPGYNTQVDTQVDTPMFLDPYQSRYQPGSGPDTWVDPSIWRNQPHQPSTAPASSPYSMPEPAQDPHAYSFDQAMEAINYGDWTRAESLLAGIIAAQPYYTRSGVNAQDALVHVRNQMKRTAAPSALKKWGFPALIGAGLALCAIASAAGLFGYVMAAPPTPTPTVSDASGGNMVINTTTPPPTATPVSTAAPVITAAPVVYTQPAIDTPVPTNTPLPPTPPPTERPDPTQTPEAGCCTLRVRNRAGSPLWIGTKPPYGGNTIQPNWYLEFYLSGPQPITIWYCEVSPDGSPVDCDSKDFELSEPLQQESVP